MIASRLAAQPIEIRRKWGGAGAAVTSVLASLLVGSSIQDPHFIRYVVTATVALGLVGLGARSPALMLLGAVVWLAGLGLVRRLVSEIGVASHLDPLVLIGPLVLTALALVAVRGGAFESRSRLTVCVAVLSGLTLIESVNPLQGSLFGGIAGLLFVFVPMTGFWIGRMLDDRTMTLLFSLVAVLGVAVGAYGLFQTVVGFPSWDSHWIDEVSFASLNVGGVIRPFATFSSAAEFAGYLSVAIVVWVSAAWGLRYLLPAGVALGVLIPALVLESSRGFVVLLVVALGAMAGARLRLPPAMAAGLGVLLVLGLAFGLRHYGPTSYGRSSSGALLAHDVSGLSDPLNPDSSTVGSHLSLLVNGLKSAYVNPLGYGIGHVTRAGATFGGVSATTEADPSNAAVALGVPGLLAYLGVLLLGMRTTYLAARRRRDMLSLVALGVVVATAFQWLNGGLYSVAVLPWIALGWADRSESDRA